MNNQQIIEKAIAKAIEGGWNGETVGLSLMTHTNGYYLTSGDGEFDIKDLYPLIIFNHDFAKALWPGTFYSPENVIPKWQYHLQQMVISEDPIAYLGENI